MLHFEVKSDRDVTVDAIGLLEADVPVVVTVEMRQLFKVIHGVDLVNANFPHFVSVTAVIDEDDKSEEK